MGLITVAILTAAAATASDPEVPIERFTLENGIRVIAVHVPDATHQMTFAFLPLHLGNDGPERAQWSHLLEHHVLRSTGPRAPAAEGLEINGETTDSALRLDVVATAERWPEAIDRLARWLQARQYEQDVHEGEIVNIASEERFTVGNGYTHKFSLAAWNQIVRHGLEHAAVHGDVAHSRLGDVHDYAERHLSIDKNVWIFTIGPIELATAREGFEERIGGIEQRVRSIPKASRQNEPPARIDATWDLTSRHVMLWRKVADEKPQALASMTLLGLALQEQLHQDAGPRARYRTPLVHSNVATPEGRYFVINVVVNPAADANAVIEHLENVMRSPALAGTAAHMARNIAMQVGPADFEMIRNQFPARQRHHAEGAWLLQRAHLEYAFRMPFEDALETIRRVDAKSLEEFAGALCGGPSGALVLDHRYRKQQEDSP